MTRYFEDFSVGERFETDGLTITDADIIAFAMKYDPQPFHLDREAGKRSMFGGLAAAGMHTLCVTNRLVTGTRLFRACNLGGEGLDDVRFVAPVFEGDTLRATVEVTEAHPSASDPGRGRLRVKVTTVNQKDDVVMTLFADYLLACRAAAS
ncbi:MAG: MaoC family dehydratase [Alphaproteobacteria bacterium]